MIAREGVRHAPNGVSPNGSLPLTPSLLIDLHHRPHLLVTQVQVVRLPRVLLHPLDQLPFVSIAHFHTTGTPHHLRHRLLLSWAPRGAVNHSVAAAACDTLAPALQTPATCGHADDGNEFAMNDRPLRIYVCGRLAVECGEMVWREADLPARQGRRLWTYLVVHRLRPVSRDDLAVALWGDDVPDAWDPTLSALVSRIRRTLGPITTGAPGFALRGEPGRYVLTLPPRAFVDLERARAAIHETDRLMYGEAFGEALAEARVAMEIAGRGFLPGEEAPWIEGQRRALVDIRLRAQERTVEAELGRGRADLAEAEARALVALDPLREAGYRLLMRALAAGGNTAQATRVFAECRQALREQAATVPSAETERLFREIAGA